VVEIVSHDDENTMEGPVFKRRWAAVAVTSHSSFARRPASFRDHPLSASSHQGFFALEGGGASLPEPAPASKLHLVLQQILKGFQKGAMEGLSETVVRDSLALSLSEFFAQSDALSHEAESRVKEQLALVEAKAKEELALAKEQLAQQA